MFAVGAGRAAAAIVLLAGCSGEKRVVRGLELTSTSSPPMRLRVDSGFAYQGRIAYPLDSTFAGERYIFAHAKASALQRLLVIQFERIRAPSSEVYRYNVDAGQPIGSLRFIENTFAFPGARDAVSSPRDEAERTNNFLLSRGFRMPAVWLVTRYVTIGDADRKREMIVFYMEGHNDLTMRDLYSGEEPTAAWQGLKPTIAAHARAAFSIE